MRIWVYVFILACVYCNCAFTAAGALLGWPGWVRLCHTCSRAEPAADWSSSANLTVFLPRHFPAWCQRCYLSICMCVFVSRSTYVCASQNRSSLIISKTVTTAWFPDPDAHTRVRKHSLWLFINGLWVTLWVTSKQVSFLFFYLQCWLVYWSPERGVQ